MFSVLFFPTLVIDFSSLWCFQNFLQKLWFVWKQICVFLQEYGI